MSPNIIQILLLHTTLLFFLSACGGLPAQTTTVAHITDLALAPVPNVAAEFKTTRAGETGHDATVAWRFWRDGNQVVIEKPQSHTADSWQRDGESIIQRMIYHDDRRAIEFQHDDLRILQAPVSWQKIVLLLNPQIPEQLTASIVDGSGAYPTREYQGKTAGTEWRIVMRTDLALPVLVERRRGAELERTELLQAYPLQNAPWRPTSIDGYDVIDFADLGDKEYDPFVIKVLAQMGIGHHH